MVADRPDSGPRPKIAVIFYSLTGNVAALARAVAHGASLGQADVRLRRVEDHLPDDQLSPAARAAREQMADLPIATIDDLTWADGVAFGSPTRFGSMAAPLKQFIDETGPLWRKGALVGKVAAVFTSTATQHGGNETTLITMMIPLFHLGYLVLGLPYTEQRQVTMTEIHGGSPYGVSSVSGWGSDRRPTDNDLQMAVSLGRRLATTAGALRP